LGRSRTDLLELVAALDLISAFAAAWTPKDHSGTDYGAWVADVRERPGQADGAGRPGLDLSPAKLLRPLVRPGTIRRSSLIERLGRGDDRPIVSVVAPAGYGKTTLLSEWAERNGQAFAWLSVDQGDNDPKVLLSYVAEALDAVEPGSAYSTRWPPR
jgi:hypothetical protein